MHTPGYLAGYMQKTAKRMVDAPTDRELTDFITSRRDTRKKNILDNLAKMIPDRRQGPLAPLPRGEYPAPSLRDSARNLGRRLKDFVKSPLQIPPDRPMPPAISAAKAAPARPVDTAN